MIPFFSQINPSDFGSQSLKYKLLFWDLFSFGVEPQVKISVKLSQVETLRQQETGGGGGLICTLCMFVLSLLKSFNSFLFLYVEEHRTRFVDSRESDTIKLIHNAAPERTKKSINLLLTCDTEGLLIKQSSLWYVD